MFVCLYKGTKAYMYIQFFRIATISLRQTPPANVILELSASHTHALFTSGWVLSSRHVAFEKKKLGLDQRKHVSFFCCAKHLIAVMDSEICNAEGKKVSSYF